MAGTFDLDQTGPRMSSSQPTSPPPAQLVFSRASTGPRATPAPQGPGAVMGAGGSMSGVPTNEEIEAKIQAAMSSAAARLATNPPRDTRTQLFVGNLPYRVRWQDLKDLFRRSGTVLRADVSLGPDNRSRGYGTVLLATAEDAGRAMDMFNGYVWQTRTLEVRPDRMGLAGGVGNGATSGAGLGSGANISLTIGSGDVADGFGTPGFGATPNLGATMGTGFDNHTLSPLAAASGLGGIATSAASTNGVNTPFAPGRLGSTSPFLGGDEGAGLAAQLARVASPSCIVGAGMSLHSPLLASVGGNGISLNSPRSVHSQLTSATASGERSRSLFVGNLPFHIQWQDLKDLFRQAGTILRADVALGPDGRSRGFGTVSFATEADAERAVRMFNSYDFNGRQLKVHFDKFAAPSATAAPLVGLPMSAPQSPHPGSFASPHPLSHTPSFAQQILLYQQQQRLDQQRQDQYRQDLLNPLASLQRVNADTDQVMYKLPLPTDDPPLHSTNFASLENPPNHHLTRARSDSAAQLLHTQPPLAQPPFFPRHSEPQVEPTHTLQSQASLHISLPPHHHTYPFDFSPGLPYGYDSYHTANIPSEPVADSVASSTPGARPEGEPVQQAGVLDTRNQTVTSPSAQEPLPALPSTSFPQEPSAHQRPPPPQATSSTGSQQGSQPSSAQNSQPATQVTSPAATSPQSATSSSLHSHPAHPGPIALPPPVTAFPIPPSLSPVYHPQMSPYASPMNHPGMMMSINMTPYGLPPITPSMPSFQFVPQPSPGPAPSGGSADLFSPPGAPHGGFTPGGTLDAQAQAAGGYPSHLRQSHGVMLSPYTPFSPGVTMSPGAFWGRPGSGAANPYINPAPGAPVHLAPTGYFPPVPPQQMEEPQGYFPPFLPNSGSSATMRPTGLSNEITRDGSSVSGSDGEGTSAGRGEGGEAAVTGAVVVEKRPQSTASEETTAGTGGRTDTETSTRPSSSNATSWKTDSANPSPSRAPELEKHMQDLAIGEDNSKTSAVLEAEPLSVRDMVAEGEHDKLMRRPSLGANGTSVTGSVAA